MQFGLLGPELVQKLSVAKISSEQAYDEHGNPRFNGVNDPRLGTVSRDFRCLTCRGGKSSRFTI